MCVCVCVLCVCVCVACVYVCFVYVCGACVVSVCLSVCLCLCVCAFVCLCESRPSHFVLPLSFPRRSTSNRTVKLKKIQEGTHAHELMRYASATLGSGNIKQAVALPEGEDLNEWVAVNSESLCVCVVCVRVRIHIRDVVMRHLSSLLPSLSQPWTSSTRSTCSMGLSQSSVHQSLVRSCLLGQSE